MSDQLEQIGRFKRVAAGQTRFGRAESRQPDPARLRLLRREFFGCGVSWPTPGNACTPVAGQASPRSRTSAG